ncbi:MAG: hypothetical protein GY941_23950 [Planctomycetes bacterium]|nr:hypothetical protein [Planctomycetota bacterium]
MRKIGEWGLSLEKSTPGPQKKDTTIGVVVTNTKKEAIKAAGMSQSTLSQREQIAQAPLISATPGQRGRALWRK